MLVWYQKDINSSPLSPYHVATTTRHTEPLNNYIKFNQTNQNHLRSIVSNPKLSSANQTSSSFPPVLSKPDMCHNRYTYQANSK